MADNNTNMTMRISLSEAFALYLTDSKFREYIDTGCFVYQGFGYLTRIQVRAAKIPNGLIFEESAEQDSTKLKKKFPDNSENRAALERTKAQIEHFIQDYEYNYQLAQTANKRLWAHMQAQHWNATIFQEKTLLTEVDYSRVKNENHNFDLRSLTAMAVGLCLDTNEYKKVLELAGICLRQTNKEEMAYSFIIASLHRKPIEECNAFLEGLGYKPLGTQSRK